MKKKTLMLAIIAVLTAALSACGSIDEPLTTVRNESESSSVSEEESPDDSQAETEAPVETAAPEESQPEEVTTSEPEEEVDVPDILTPTISKHEWLLQTIKFESYFEDEYRFHELVRLGLANAYDEGKAYAVVPQSGGAGHMYYKVYFTDDGGESWTEGEVYDEINGENRHFALEDGGIMLFSLNSPRSETYPVVIYLCFDGSGIKSVELKEFLAQTVLSDGRLLSETSGLDYEITYRYDHVFKITITDGDSGEVLRDDDFDFQYAVDYALESQQIEPMD